ncbi:hypothetical protein [Pseudotenacibaculum haliotis]|uniref:Uncharacterized protein n=1 Tax=Pseudotenacibaculum haliotis TaxID=1862138 RepID=A0ABW5LW18_9FLAO
MEELIKRARIILNILILSGLILGWSAYKKPANVYKNAQKIYEITSDLRNLKSLENTNLFVQNAKNQINNGLKPFENTTIGQILAIERDEPKMLFNFESNKIIKPSQDFAEALRDHNFYLAKIEDSTLLKKGVSARPQIFIQEDRLELLNQINIIKSHWESTKLKTNAPLSKVNEDIKTYIELPILNERVNTDLAIILISYFIIGPLLMFLSIAKAMSKVSTKMTEGISWVFFHPGKLGFILGTIQLLIPLTSILFTIILARMKLIYILPIGIIAFILSFLCIREVLNARKKFYIKIE